MFITSALALNHVPRWVVVHMTRPQSVAEHCFNVAVITVELIHNHPVNAVSVYSAVFHALTHDIDECVTGDVPSHAKKYLNGGTHGIVPVPPITVAPTDRDIVKLADIIDAYTYVAKYGAGSHAMNVRGHMKQVLDKQIESMGVNRAGITKLTTDIIAERGRIYK